MDLKKFLDNVYLIKDSYNNYSNLVIGDSKALVFDTGLGLENLKEKIREITNLPLLVINSHGHIDHIGGNYQFDQVYLSKDDLSILDNYNQELLEDWLSVITGEKISLENTYKSDFNVKILNFDSFDLGNLKGKIINLKGHSKGSIGIYFPKLKLLLSGDALQPIMTLVFDNHGNIDDQKETLERANNLDFDFYLTGHSGRVFPKSYINKLLKCLKNSRNKKHNFYKYPKPPYSPGFYYTESFDKEIIGIAVSHLD